MNEGLQHSLSRRELLYRAAGIATCSMAPPYFLKGLHRRQPLRLGIDNFAVRGMGWKANRLVEYAASLGCDTLFITDLGAFESLEDGALREVKRHADQKKVDLLVGTWSVCPSSVEFRDTWGSADEHLALGIRVAAALGSPVIRVILGSHRDRLAPGGIDARIADMVRVLRRARPHCLDLNVKVAVENHAGDMHSLELVRLIEDAGPEFVGANLDSGNAVWALEDPLENLENLGCYALATSLRDAVAWETDDGALLQWTAMGEGQIDWKRYFARFVELCPETAVNVETISGRNFAIQYKTEAFQKAWPAGRPEGFDRFLAFVERGMPRPEYQRPADTDPARADRQYQRNEIERSIAWCRRFGLGRRANPE